MPKQKKPCLDWQPHKAELQNLYLVQDLSLERLTKYMKQTHGFHATKAQYESQFKKWDMRKYLTNEEWNYTLLRVRKRKLDEKESDVYLNGRLIPEKRVKKEMSRHFTLTQEQLFLTVSTPSTPEAITVSTPNASIPTTAGSIDILHNLPYFQFKALLESAALLPAAAAQDRLAGAARQIALNAPDDNLAFFTSKDSHDGNAIALFQSPFRSTSDEDGQMLLYGLFGSAINMNGDGFLSSIRSQMLVSSVERYDGEVMEKSQLLCGPLTQSSALRILEYALYRISNNMLWTEGTDAFLRWLIKQKQNGLLLSFLKTQIPTVHACAANFLQSALRLGDADFLELLIDSGIDISPLKDVHGGRHLVYAACQGDMRITRILLKNGANVNLSPTPYQLTALQAATKKGHAHIVQVLLKAGANVDAVSGSKRCNTALSEAVHCENVELVHILLTAGANIDICTINHRSAIQHSAILGDNEELHRILLSASSKDNSSITSPGVLEAASTDTQALSKYLAARGKIGAPVQDVLESALRFACKDSDHSAVLSLLDIGVDPNCLLPKNIGDPLRAAVSRRDFELIEILLQAGANVNTPGILISAMNHDENLSYGTHMLQFMLDAGVNIKIHGGEALRHAAYKGYFEVVQFLVLSGVDVNANAYEKADGEADYSFHKASVLQCAVSSGNIRLVKSLVDMGADVNAIIYDEGLNEGQTALDSAVFKAAISDPRSLEIVRALLEAGADVNIPEEDRIGPTVLESAVYEGDEELVFILLEAGADVNSPPKGKYGQTPIQSAAKMGYLPLVKLLLELGANINAPAGHYYGKTAIQAASSAEWPKMELIDLLLGAGADINAPAGYVGGLTALQGAAMKGHMGIARKFLEAGADVNAAAAIFHGRTALDGAAERGRLDMVQMLLNAGAVGDSTKSHRFDRAIELARVNGQFAVASFLERA